MAKADSANTTSRRAFLAGAASTATVIPLIGLTALPVAASLSEEEAEFAKLSAIFLPIWERYLPVHQRFAETVDDDGPGGAYHAAWEEWNTLDALARPVAHTVLEYEVSSPRDLAVKAAAALITETAGDGIGDDIRPALANLLLEVVAAGGMVVPDYSWDAENDDDV